VVFTDGSVKTFSDAAQAVYKYILRQTVARGSDESANLTLYEMAQIWNNYFDPLYAQD